MTDFSTVSTSASPVGEKGKEWLCYKKNYCPQLIIFIRNGWIGLEKKNADCRSGQSLCDKTAACGECIRKGCKLCSRFALEVPRYPSSLSSSFIPKPHQSTLGRDVFMLLKGRSRMVHTAQILPQWNIQMVYLIWKAFCQRKLSWSIGFLRHFSILRWSEYQSLLLQTSQMWPLVPCLWASLLDSLHLLSSCPQTPLVLLSGERHVPTRKANYLPLATFPCACTCAGDLHTDHSEQAPWGVRCWEKKNNHSDLTWVSEGMSDGDACAFSSPKIILISILCCTRSRSGQAYRTLGSSWQPCAL